MDGRREPSSATGTSSAAPSAPRDGPWVDTSVWPGSLFGPALQDCIAAIGSAVDGVVLFGSVARRTAMESSDADILVVLRPGTRITPDFYDRWNAVGRWLKDADGHLVNPYFAARPQANGKISGFWCEVARDGVVLWERGGTVSAILAHLRTRVARGDITEERTGGVTYWVHRRASGQSR